MIIFFNVIKRIMTKKSNLLFMLILPTFLSTFIVLISTTGNKYTVGIIDNDNTAFTGSNGGLFVRNSKVNGIF